MAFSRLRKSVWEGVKVIQPLLRDIASTVRHTSVEVGLVGVMVLQNLGSLGQNFAAKMLENSLIGRKWVFEHLLVA